MNQNNKTTGDTTSTAQPVNFIRRLWGWILGIILILLATVSFLTYRYVQSSLKPFDRHDEKIVTVKIPIGSSNKAIATKLQHQKIVRSAVVFEYYIKSKKIHNLQAGTYRLSPAMTPAEIVKKLQKGATKPHVVAKILIKEGATATQVAQTIARKNKWDKSSVLKLLNNQDFLKQLARAYPKLDLQQHKQVRYQLEGYLAPLTYDVTSAMTLKELLTEMVSMTNVELKPYYATIKKQNLKIHDVLTLASLVERETDGQSARRKMAGLLQQRLRQHDLLATNSSVLYALNVNRKLTAKDMGVNSPYNLYLHKGMGPGPICQPSPSSIKAVLHPITD